jgi:anti-anti-sigma factor
MENNYMDFIREVHGDVLVEIVNISRATLKEAEQFKQTLTEDVNEGWRKIVVDLTDCEFIDSTFLGALVVTLKKITTLGGDLRLVGFQPAVHTMFELTRMYRVFEAFEQKEEAINSFRIAKS